MKINVLLVSLAMACLAGLSPGAAAQTLSLKLDNGTVTLEASDVTVDEILARWSATTGLTVVSQNGHGSDIPVTLRLSGVSEREALSMVLRDLSGYIMGERRDPATGVTRIDRLVILPDSAARPPEGAPLPRRRPMPAPAAAIENDVAIPMELAPVADDGADETEP